MGAGVVQREKGWTGVEAGAGPRAEEHRGLQKPGKARARILPSGLWGTQPADTSISALRDPFRASAVQNAEGISLCCLQPLGWGNWSELRQEAHGGGRRAEGGPAQPGAGGTWCRELLIFGAQEKPPWTPSCRTL